MLITEKLYLLMASDREKPESVVSATGYGMNAALISDLMIAGRVALSDDQQRQIQLIGAGPCPDPVLAAPLAKLEKKEQLSLDEAVRISGLCDARLVTDSLAKAGIVEYGERTLLGMGKKSVRIINEQRSSGKSGRTCRPPCMGTRLRGPVTSQSCQSSRRLGSPRKCSRTSSLR